jgi:tetratricopeptide (TPR) repeat protein
MSRVDEAVSLAFAGRLARARTVLGSDRSERARWLRAYLDCAEGRFGSALRRAGSLSEDARDRAVRVAASVTAGSALRQMGEHRRARAFDERALRSAATRPERAHALIGLAADAVGAGDAAGCARRLARAAEFARGDARAGIRLDWVRAEHALMTGDARAAARFAKRALARSRAREMKRHEAKSSLFYGVALAAAGDEEAAKHLRTAERIARRIGAKPIATVAHDVRTRAR